MKRPLNALIGVACVSYLVHLLWSRRGTIGQAFELDAATLGILVLLVFASHVQRAIEFDYMLKRLGIRETLAEGFLLTAAAALLNYLPFSAGSVARALALRRKHALSYTHYASALAVATIMSGVIAALSGLGAALTLRHSAGAALLVVFGTVAGAGALVLCFPASWAPRGQSRLEARVRDAVQGLALIRHGGQGLVVLTAIALGRVALNAARLWLCFRALGVELSPSEVTLIGSSVVLATLFTLAPGNLGVRELLLGGVWGLISGSPTLGVAAATIDRAVWLAYTVAAGLPGLAYLRRAVARSEPTPGENANQDLPRAAYGQTREPVGGEGER